MVWVSIDRKSFKILKYYLTVFFNAVTYSTYPWEVRNSVEPTFHHGKLLLHEGKNQIQISER